MLFGVYKVQVRDAWGLWSDVAEYDSEEKARRFVNALKRDFPNMELRVVYERTPTTSLAVVACVFAVVALPVAISLLIRKSKTSYAT
jgi:hypothetical protein